MSHSWCPWFIGTSRILSFGLCWKTLCFLWANQTGGRNRSVLRRMLIYVERRTERKGKERKEREGKARKGKGREGKGKRREGKEGAGRKEGRQEGRKARRKAGEGRKEGREGRKEGRKQGRKQASKQGRKEASKQAIKEGRKQASKQSRKEASKQASKQGRKEGRKETCLNQQRDSNELKPEGSSVTCSKWWRMSCPTCGISLRCRRCRWCCCDFADFRSYFYGHDELRRPVMSVMSCELLRMWLSSSSPQVSRLCELVDNNGKDIKAATWVTWQISCAEDSGWYIVRVLKDVKTLAYCGMSDIN